MKKSVFHERMDQLSPYLYDDDIAWREYGSAQKLPVQNSYIGLQNYREIKEPVGRQKGLILFFVSRRPTGFHCMNYKINTVSDQSGLPPSAAEYQAALTWWIWTSRCGNGMEIPFESNVNFTFSVISKYTAQ